MKKSKIIKLQPSFDETRKIGAQICNKVFEMLTQESTWMDRLIESGSGHFLTAFAEINMTGAKIETGESINEFSESLRHAKSSLTNLKQMLEIYRSLINGVKPLNISEQIKTITKEFDYEGFHERVVKEGVVPDETKLWNELRRQLEKGDRVSGVELFIDKCASIEKPLSEFIQKLESNNLDSRLLHKIETSFHSASTIGKLLVFYNYETRIPS